MNTALLALTTALGLAIASPTVHRAPARTATTSSSASSDSLRHPEWSRHAVIYEVNVRQFTPEGTLVALQRHLPRLKRLGVDILWVMPVQPIGVKNRKGVLGSYYAISDYTAVN